MDFSYSEEQSALRELARKILEEQATPERVREIERGEDRLDRALWRELAKANLLGVALPERCGGSGYGFFELCLLLEEVGRVVAPIPAWPTLVLGALPLAEFGTREQQQRLLPGVVAGELILSGALGEPENDDALRPTTRVAAGAGAHRLTGTKICVPAAHAAARVLVPATASDGRVQLFLVDPRGPGVHLATQVATNRELQSRMVLDGARVCEDDRLGSLDEASAALAWTLARATTALCAIQVGVADRVLGMTARYTSQRQQFGRPIGSFQAVHQRAADAFIDVEAMRLVLWQAAFRLARGEPAAVEVAVAKFWAAEAGHRVAYAAQHLHGGIGVDVDYPVHRYYLWARQLELTLGSAAPQLETLGRLLADAPGAGIQTSLGSGS